MRLRLRHHQPSPAPEEQPGDGAAPAVTVTAVSAALRTLFREAGVRIDPLLTVERSEDSPSLHVGGDLLLRRLDDGRWQLAGAEDGDPVTLAAGASAREVAAAVMAAAIDAWD